MNRATQSLPGVPPGPTTFSRSRPRNAGTSVQHHSRSTLKTRLSSLALFALLSLFTCSVARGATNAAYEIGTWRGFRPAAISYTFDDGCSNQFSLAVPMFNEKGFKLTLFTVINTMFPGWPKLQAAAANGHEIASHTLNHANLGSVSDAQQTIELQNSQAAINANVTNQRCATMAYPFCVQGRDSITSQFYIAARTCSGQLVPSTPANFMAISSFICGSLGTVQTALDFQNRANSAAASKGWLVYLIHGIDGDGGYSPLPSATLRASLDYLGANRDKFWVDTFGNVTRYIRERNAATITETSSNATQITLQVSDNLDDVIFDYPITVRRALPATWTAAAACQNGRPLPVQIVDLNGSKHLMFDVVPDRGEVRIGRQASQTSLSDPGLLSPFSFGFRLDGEPGLSYVIETSSDLVSWASIQTNTLLAPSTNLNLPLSNTVQFFRAEWRAAQKL
jgi:peptidoglycan/xylan/chitin deacetylase (PgdA/CDA1 family)